MKFIHILIRDDEFANVDTSYERYCEYDEHFLISSEEYTDEKKAELNALLDLYNEYQNLDFLDCDNEILESDRYEEVADVSKYNLLVNFFNQFTNYFQNIHEVYIG